MTPTSISVPAEALPAWLEGEWSVERDIDAGRGTFTGTATFAPEDDGSLRWAETGTLRFENFSGPVGRTLFVHAAAPWEVRFDDGLPFHPLDLSRGRTEVEHLCGPDVYRGRYDPVSDDELVVEWAVTGPGRDDAIVSRYRRRSR